VMLMEPLWSHPWSQSARTEILVPQPPTLVRFSNWLRAKWQGVTGGALVAFVIFAWTYADRLLQTGEHVEFLHDLWVSHPQVAAFLSRWSLPVMLVIGLWLLLRYERRASDERYLGKPLTDGYPRKSEVIELIRGSPALLSSSSRLCMLS